MLSIFKKEAPAIVESISNIKELIREGNDYFSEELIILDEQLTGNLFCAEKVSIEHRGTLNGNIASKTCTVTGTVNGDILSLDLLDIKSTAVVRGDIQSAAVNIEPGAVINGYITVGEDIESLTEQWNKTKFSTDDHLSTKLAKELSELNKASEAINIVVKQEVPKAVIAKPEVKAVPLAAAKPEIKAEPAKVTEPIPAPAIAAAAPPQKAKEEEPVNNQRWW